MFERLLRKKREGRRGSAGSLRRWLASELDAVLAAVGNEEAMHRLITMHNTICELSITVRVEPLRPEAGWIVSWSSRSADQVIRASGALPGIPTPYAVEEAVERLVWSFCGDVNPRNWRSLMKAAVKRALEDEESVHEYTSAAEAHQALKDET